MEIATVMTRGVRTCSQNDTLERAAQIMFEADCGLLPVTDDQNRTVGVITDRDICRAACIEGKPLTDILVWAAVSKPLVAARPDASLDDVAELMRSNQIRRVPIVDAAGQAVGIVSLADLARPFARDARVDGTSPDGVARTLAAIVQPSPTPPLELEETALGAGVEGVRGPYHVRSVEGAWEVFDGEGRRVSERQRTQGDAVVHAKELAYREGSAQIVVHREDGSIASEFFYQREERPSLELDDATPSVAASRPARAEPSSRRGG